MLYSEIHGKHRRNQTQEEFSSDDSDIEAYRIKNIQIKSLQSDYREKMLQFIMQHVQTTNDIQDVHLDEDPYDVQMEDYFAQPPRQIQKSPTFQNEEKFLEPTPQRLKTHNKHTENHSSDQQKRWLEYLPPTEKNQKMMQSYIQPNGKPRQITPKQEKENRLKSQKKLNGSQIQFNNNTFRTDDSCSPKPKINERSKLLVEQRFQRESEDKNSITYKFLTKKDMSIQTLESFPIPKMKITVPKKKAPDTANKTQSSKPRKSSVKTQGSQKEFKETSMQTETELYEEMKKWLVSTPKKSERRENMQTDSRSGSKQSYYLPIHERYKIEVEKKKQNIKAQTLKQQEREDQMTGKSKKTSNREEVNDEQRILIFSKNQLDWVEKRRNKMMKEKIGINQKEFEECTYRPKILPKSQKIAARINQDKGSLKPEDRLLEYHYKKEQMKQEILEFLKQEEKDRLKVRQSPQSIKINKRRLNESLQNRSTIEMHATPPKSHGARSNVQTYYIGDDDDLSYEQHNSSWL